MSDEEFRICGTARHEMARLRAESAAQRALRLFAKHGNSDEVHALLGVLSSSELESPSLAMAVDYLRARLSTNLDHDAIDRSKERLVAKSKDLEDWIAKIESGSIGGSLNDNIMALARTKTSLALVAMVLDDDAHAETLYQEAIAALSSIWGADHLEVGNYCEDYATLLLKIGRMQEANAYIARACTITTNAGFTYRDRG